MSGMRLAYRRKERLGSGSGGDVYRARLWRTGQTVAVKRLTGPDVDDTRLARMRTEAQALAALKHPGIVQLYGIRRERRGLTLVMEYVDGVSLARILESGPLPMPAAVYVARETLQALGHAHERGFVHRDVSANNVLLARDGQVKLADFGLATLVGNRPTTDNHVSGTLPFVAPEQIVGSPLDGRADLFAVGVLLHVMLAGQAPFPGTTVVEQMNQILGGVRTGESLPGAIATIVVRLLQRQRDARFASAADVLAALPPDEHGQAQLSALVETRLPHPRRRHSMTLWLAAATAIGVALGYHGRRTETPNTKPLERSTPVQLVEPASTTQPDASKPKAPNTDTTRERTSENSAKVATTAKPSKKRRKSKSAKRHLKVAPLQDRLVEPPTRISGATWEFHKPMGETMDFSAPAAREEE